VSTYTDFPQYTYRQVSVGRRFRTFAWLRRQLQEAHRGVIIPPLPAKMLVGKFMRAETFLERRRAALQVFLQRTCTHSTLRNSPILQIFLEGDDESLLCEMKKSDEPSDMTEIALCRGSALRSVSHTYRDLKLMVSTSVGSISNTGALSPGTASGISMVEDEAIGHLHCTRHPLFGPSVVNLHYSNLRQYINGLETNLSEVLHLAKNSRDARGNAVWF